MIYAFLGSMFDPVSSSAADLEMILSTAEKIFFLLSLNVNTWLSLDSRIRLHNMSWKDPIVDTTFCVQQLRHELKFIQSVPQHDKA